MFFFLFTDITSPPLNTTVCRGNDIDVNCGYAAVPGVEIIWRINGNNEMTSREIMTMPSKYQYENIFNASTATGISTLRIFSINESTTFECRVAFMDGAYSPIGTVTVAGT